MFASKKPIAFVYHSFCMDGFGAAWAAYHFHPQKHHVFYPMSYGDEISDEVLACNEIYFLDFSVKREIIIALREAGKKVVVIDHHATAAKDLEGLEGCVFDMSRSGAVLTWNYFDNRQDGETNLYPSILRYVQDGDLYKFELPHSKEILAVFNTIPKDFIEWSSFEAKLVNSGWNLDGIIAEGAAIIKTNKRYIETVNRLVRKANVFGYENVPIVNLHPHLISDILSNLATTSECGFAMSWFEQANGTIKYSFRASDEASIDLSKLTSTIAKTNKEVITGGGHPKASGLVARKIIHN